MYLLRRICFFFFFQAEDGIRDYKVTGVQTCALPISLGLGGSTSALTMGDSKTPNTWTYNVTISQRTPGRSVAEFQYAGSRSRDLLTNGGNNGPGAIDLPQPGAYFGADPVTGQNLYSTGVLPSNFPQLNDFLPFRQYTGINLIGHLSYSNYNSFIADR